MDSAGGKQPAGGTADIAHIALVGACALICVAIGILTLTGWALHIAWLVQLQPGWVPMVVATAVCFVVASLALLLPRRLPQSLRRNVEAAASVILILLAGTNLVELGFDIDTVVDLPKLHQSLQPDNLHPGRMEPGTALAFLLIGIGLLYSQPRATRTSLSALRSLIYAALALALVGLLGYGLKLEFLYSWAGVTRMPVLVAVGLIVLATALLIRLRQRYAQLTAAADVEDILASSSFVLFVGVLTAGLVGFSVMQERVEGIIADNYMRLLQDRQALFISAIEEHLQHAALVSTRPALARLLKTLYEDPSDQMARLALKNSAESLMQQGFSAVAYEGNGGRFAEAGMPLAAPELRIVLDNHQGVALMWQDGYVLDTKLPILSGGTVVGYLRSEQPLPSLDRLTRELDQWGETGNVGICADMGEELGCFPQRGRPKPYYLSPTRDGQPVPIARALHNKTGVMVGIDSRGRRVFSAFGPIGDTGLGMNVKMEMSELYAPIRQQFQRTLPFLAALVVLGVLWMRARLRPLAQDIVAAKEQAVANEARFRTVMENVHDVFQLLECIRDSDGVIRDFRYAYINGGGTMFKPGIVERMTGSTMCTVFPSAADSTFFQGLARVANTGEPFNGEFKIQIPGFAAEWAEVRAVKYGDGVAFAAADISERKRLDKALMESEQRFRLLAANATDVIVRLDLQGRRLYASPAVRRVLGYEPEQLVGERPVAIMHPDDASKFDGAVQAMLGGLDFTSFVCRVQHRDGHWVWIEANLVLVHDEKTGEPVEIQSALRDISKRRAAEEALRVSEERLRLLFESVGDYAIMMLDPHGMISAWNTGAERMFGYRPEQIIGRNISQLIPPEERAANKVVDQLERAAADGRADIEGWRLRKDGTRFWASIVVAAVRDSEGKLVGFSRVVQDLTERRRAEEHMWQLAHFDTLTGLPNRALFFDRLNMALKRPTRGTRPMAVMFIDVDKFKHINDTLGHAAGDELLREVARRLSRCVRAPDTVARLAGDEFTVLLEGVRDVQSTERIAAKLVEAMRPPVMFEGQAIDVTLSIGAAFLEDGVAPADLLMTSADAALYEVKHNGRNGYFVINLGKREDSERNGGGVETALRDSASGKVVDLKRRRIDER